MEGISALFSAIARSLRGLFDLASMAVGVAPTRVSLSDIADLPIETEAVRGNVIIDGDLLQGGPFSLSVCKTIDVTDCTSVRH